MTTTVIIVTLNRPAYVRRCLACLAAQVPAQPQQIIVVDASADELTRQAVAEFPGVLYLRNENGFGRMTTSRNIGLRHASGEIIAFLDDDSFAHPGWLDALLATYTDPSIGAVGGRALNNQPGEATLGVHEIGRLKPDGTLTGYFAADCGNPIDVDHVMGCNMSFRREVLARLGGFREDYPGISGVREDSDMCLRVRRVGYRIVFNPRAAVDHVGAPQARGRRFDARYVFYSAQNHYVLLIANHGLFAGIAWRWTARCLVDALAEFTRKVGGALVRLGATLWGMCCGLARGIVLRRRAGRDPVRRDAEARELMSILSGGPAPADHPPRREVGHAA